MLRLPRYILMRHGDTFMDVPDDRINGWLPSSLIPKGVREVRERAKDLTKDGITHILASSLQRARQTAGIVGKVLKLSSVYDFGPRGWNLGFITGFKAKDAKPTIAFFVKHPDIPVPGGESFIEYLRRWRRCEDHIRSFAIKHPENCLLVVTHSINIGHSIDRTEGRDLSKKASITGVPPAGVVYFCLQGGNWFYEKGKNYVGY